MHFVVEGGRPLRGTVQVQPAKNVAVALIAASLLNRAPTTLIRTPRIEEVRRLLEVAHSLGVALSWDEDTPSAPLTLTPPPSLSFETLNTTAAQATRSIILFLPALLSYNPRVRLPLPGGCRLGTRTLFPHLHVLRSFGAHVSIADNALEVDARDLHAGDVVLPEASDTATEHALLLATLVSGTTTIRYASANYMVSELAHFLRRVGVRIEGIGTSTLTVHSTGTTIAHPLTHPIGEDPTDAMFFLAAALVTRSSLTIRDAPIRYLELEQLVIELMGGNVKVKRVRPSVSGVTEVADITITPPAQHLVAPPFPIHPRPYPGLNIDHLPFFAVIATQAEGETLIHDWVYDRRAIYYTELDKLGASTLLLDPHRILIRGPTPLRAAEVIAPPALRPASILLIAMLAAPGTSQLRHVYSIRRGYEALAERLCALGAAVTLTHEQDG